MTQNKIIIEKVTLDDLAIMVANGFKAVDKRFEAVDRRFEEMDARFDKMDARFDQMDSRFDRWESRFDSVEKTVFNDHGRRIRKIETKLQIA